MKTYTVASVARETLRAAGLTLRKVEGEYRVNFIGGDEDTAYYTDDLTDAVSTGLHMARTNEEG
jgi:hypothetical protein